MHLDIVILRTFQTWTKLFYLLNMVNTDLYCVPNWHASSWYMIHVPPCLTQACECPGISGIRSVAIWSVRSHFSFMGKSSFKLLYVFCRFFIIFKNHSAIAELDLFWTALYTVFQKFELKKKGKKLKNTSEYLTFH